MIRLFKSHTFITIQSIISFLISFSYRLDEFFLFLLIIMGQELFNIYMKINKGDKILDFKTGNSQESNVDVFSKM